jgi:putative transposase
MRLSNIKLKVIGAALMPKKQAVQIEADEITQRELKKLIKRHTIPQQIALRGRVILKALAGQTNAQIAREEKVHPDLVRKWRLRWQSLQERSLAELSLAQPLQDAPRGGRHPRFSPEQVCKITALACEKPTALALRPISHWSNREIAAEASRRGIVTTISARQVGRFLKEG